MTDLVSECPECGRGSANEQSFKTHFSLSHGPPYPWSGVNNGYGPKWEAKRDKVVERDGYRCQHCRLKKEETSTRALNVHHIDGDRSNDEMSNLITLCTSCHHAYDRDKNETNEADESILTELAEGRNTPQNLGDELEYSRQYMQNRLQLLKAADLVRNVGGGLYEITDSGLVKVGQYTEENDWELKYQQAKRGLRNREEQVEEACEYLDRAVENREWSAVEDAATRLGCDLE